MMMTEETKDWQYGRANIRKINNGFLASYEVGRRYQSADTGETFFQTLDGARLFIANQIALSDDMAQNIRDDDGGEPPPA